MTNVKKLEKLIDSMPTGCMLLDGDAIIKRTNELAIDAMGIPKNKLLGIPFLELLVPEFQELCHEAIDNATDEKTKQVSVRLARALAPIELSFRTLDSDHILVGIRSMDLEHRLSAQASGELTHDQLTGLPDQYHALSQLHARITANGRKPLAIVCVWIDELPTLETSHGTRAVERVIQEVGQRLQTKLRGPDLLGRFEAAGFLALLTSDAPTDQLVEIANRLRSEIAFPVHFNKKLVSFTASVALSSINGQKPSVERILALLEASGNRAVSNGGNRTDILQF